MVAVERIKCAEVEEELRAAREEKEALKGAMRVIEQENGRLKTEAPSDMPKRSDNTTPTQIRAHTNPNGAHWPDDPSSHLPSSTSDEDADTGNDTVMLISNEVDTLPKSPMPDLPHEASPWADSGVGLAQ